MVRCRGGGILDPVRNIGNRFRLHRSTVIFDAPVGDLQIESALVLQNDLVVCGAQRVVSPLVDDLDAHYEVQADVNDFCGERGNRTSDLCCPR